MITKELIDRINQLSRKQRSEGLTPTEKAEQAVLRRTYINSIKDQIRASLGNIPKDECTCDDSKCDCHHHHKHND